MAHILIMMRECNHISNDALQLALPTVGGIAQTVMLAYGLGLAAVKMMICFQKRFDSDSSPVCDLVFASLKRCEGKSQKCANRMVLGPMPAEDVGNKAIRLDFWAAFLCYFLFLQKESRDKQKDQDYY